MAQGNLISPCSASLGIVHRVFQTGPGSQHWAAMLEQLTVLVGPCGLTMKVALGPWTLVVVVAAWGSLLSSLSSLQIWQSVLTWQHWRKRGFGRA